MGPLFGQNTQVYEGQLQIANYKGTATYGYELKGKDTILDGPFKLQSSNLEALLTKEDSTFLIDGAFNNGLPTGFWKFKFGIFKAQAQSQVVDYQYRILASGIQEEVQGLLLKGKPNGPWEYVVNSIKDANIRSTLFKSSIIFDNGIPQRNFRIESDSTTLVGRFLRNGLAHDAWEVYGIYNADATEKWFFKDGILEKIVNTINSEQQTISVFNNIEQQTKIVNLDTKYLQILSIKLQSDTYSTLMNGSMSRLLHQNAAYYAKVDTILSVLGASKFTPSFGVSLPYYPTDTLDTKFLDTISINVKKSIDISESYLNNTLLNILKLSDKEAARLYLAIEMITKDYVAPLQKLVTYNNHGLLEFLTPGERVRNMWPEGISAAIIMEKTNKLPSLNLIPDASLLFDFEHNTMEAIANLSKYTTTQLQHIQKKLSDKLSKEERQQELIELEKILLFENKVLAQKIDSVGTTLAPTYQKALSHIKSVMDSNLNDFSSQEELNRARELVQCYKQMNVLASEVIGLTARSLELGNLYKERIWNPFMATLMDEEVKKRIINSYKKVLVPYFLERIGEDLTCDNVTALLIQIKSTQERMMALREEDTKKLERKLRNEEDPIVILELLNVQLALNNEEG